MTSSQSSQEEEKPQAASSWEPEPAAGEGTPTISLHTLGLQTITEMFPDDWEKWQACWSRYVPLEAWKEPGRTAFEDVVAETFNRGFLGLMDTAFCIPSLAG